MVGCESQRALSFSQEVVQARESKLPFTRPTRSGSLLSAYYVPTLGRDSRDAFFFTGQTNTAIRVGVGPIREPAGSGSDRQR